MLQAQYPTASFALPSSAAFQPTSDPYAALDAAGLLWPIESVPVAAMAPVMTPDGMIDRQIPIGGTVAHLRGDTRQPIGIVSSSYETYDNVRIAELIDRMIQASPTPVEVDSAIEISGGSGILVGLSTHRYSVVNDPMDSRVYLHSRHDGRGGLSVFPMQTRLRCSNQIAYGMSQGIRLRHSADIARQADEFLRVVGSTWSTAENFRAEALSMTRRAESNAIPEVLGRYLERTMAAPTLRPGESPADIAKRTRAWRKRYDEAHTDIVERYQFSAAMDGLPMTRWRALQAILEHEEHRAGKGDLRVARAMPTSAPNRRKLVALEVCLDGI